EDFTSKVAITAEPLALTGGSLSYVDRSAAAATTYWYWVQVNRSGGSAFMNGPVSATMTASTALTFARKVEPNPFRSGTELEFTVGNDAAGAGPAPVLVEVRDVQGRLVRRLLSGPMPVGIYHVRWDATDRAGARVRPGAYFLTLAAG